MAFSPDLEQALKLIPHIPQKVLQAHKSVVIHALQYLHSFLEHDAGEADSCSHSCRFLQPQRPPHTKPHRCFNDHSSRPSQKMQVTNLPKGMSSRPSKISLILKSLRASKLEIDRLLKLNPMAAIEGTVPLSTDFRIVDLAATPHSLQGRMRRVLSQRSLAQDFERWKACQDAKCKPSDYVLRLELDTETNVMAYQGIVHGLKLLDVDRKLSAWRKIQLNQAGNPNCVSASSAILGFAMTHLKMVKLEDLGALAESLGKSEWITIIESKSDWFQKCQELYRGKCSFQSNTISSRICRRASASRANNKTCRNLHEPVQ